MDYRSPRSHRNILAYAIEMNNSQAVKILIQNGINTNDKSKDYLRYALMGHLSRPRYKIATYLVMAGSQGFRNRKASAIAEALMLYHRGLIANRVLGQDEDCTKDVDLFLNEYLLEVKSAKYLCRIAIRRSLRSLKPQSIRSLHIPNVLHDYLMCMDIV